MLAGSSPPFSLNFSLIESTMRMSVMISVNEMKNWFSWQPEPPNQMKNSTSRTPLAMSARSDTPMVSALY